MPELSYGSHMFQDMVEAEMSYSAVFNDHKTIRYDPSVLQDVEDRFAQICPDMEELSGMISVREPENLYYWLDSVGNHAVCGAVDLWGSLFSESRCSNLLLLFSRGTAVG